MHLHTQTTAMIEAIEAPQDCVVLLPLGATEQHGLHLPLGTDTLIVEAVIAAALSQPQDLPQVLVLPTLCVTHSPEHTAFAGTLSLSAQTMLFIFSDLGASLQRSGFRRLVMVNGHGGNVPLLELAAQSLRLQASMLAVHATLSRFGVPDGLLSEHEMAYGMHAGAVETALMMAIEPELVKQEHVQPFSSAAERWDQDHAVLSAGRPAPLGWMMQDINPQGAAGDATLATPAMGQAILQHRAKTLRALLQDVAMFDLAQLRDRP